MSYSNKSVFYEKIGKSEIAKDFVLKAYTILLDVYGADHHKTKTYLKNFNALI